MARSNLESPQPQPPRPMDVLPEAPQDDLRELTAVMAEIMPVLDRIQSRSPQAGALGLYGQASVETLAAVALVGDLGADSLRRLTAYLDVHAEAFPGLEHCAPVVAAAARALLARNYAQGFALLFDVYRTIILMRLEDNKLPPPGSVLPRPRAERRPEGAQPH